MTEIETYEHILSVASDLITENGFANVSMNDIVKATGLSKGGIYWHFKSKDDIIIAIVDRIFTEQIELIDEILPTEGRAEERIMELVQYIGATLEEMTRQAPTPLDIYALAIRHNHLKHQLQNYFRQYQARLADLIQQGQDRGEFQVTDVAHSAFNFIGMIEGTILLSMMMQQEATVADMLLDTTQTFLKGIQAGENNG